MDPRQIWAEGQGQSKAKTLRIIWPELAEALDGAVTGADDPDAAQPPCQGCGRPAIGRAGTAPVCGRCCARVPYAGRKLTRVLHWKAGS